MVPASIHDFFVASGSVAGALIGLLFVAISVSLVRLAQDKAGAPLHRVRAAAALTAFTNALAVSLFALIPGHTIGPAAVAGAAGGLLLITASLLSLIRLRQVRRDTALEALFIAGLAIVFVAQQIVGAEVIAERDVPGAVNTIAILVVLCYMIGIVQAWELIGGPSIGITQEIMALVRGRERGADDSDAGTVDPGELAGMTMEQNAVMTATSVHAPPHPNTGAVFRTLEGDGDWRQSFELAAAVHAGEPGGDAGFLTAQLAAKRALTEAGHGAWFGAFLDGTLVSQLGLIPNKTGLARYQSVETHPAARRRGLAGTLVWHASATTLTGDTKTLVMVADPDDTAIRVYRSLGFTVTESQLSFIRQPARRPARPRS